MFTLAFRVPWVVFVLLLLLAPLVLCPDVLDVHHIDGVAVEGALHLTLAADVLVVGLVPRFDLVVVLVDLRVEAHAGGQPVLAGGSGPVLISTAGGLRCLRC